MDDARKVRHPLLLSTSLPTHRVPHDGPSIVLKRAFLLDLYGDSKRQFYIARHDAVTSQIRYFANSDYTNESLTIQLTNTLLPAILSTQQSKRM